MTRNFEIDLRLGEKAERDFAQVLKTKMTTVRAIQKVDHARYPYDLRVTVETGLGTVDRTVEVKSLAGGYPTVCVEVWADDNQTRRPHWFHPDVDIIAFQDRSCNTWFLYQAQEVIKFLKEYDGRLTRADNGCKDARGWIGLFSWNGGVEGKSLPGFLTMVKGE
jgi:hypothetical protein